MLEKIKQAALIFTKYMPIAAAAMLEAEKSGLDGASKFQMAMMIILAVAHEGGKANNANIATIAFVLEMVVGIANARGQLGAPKPVVIEIPAAEAAKP